VPAPSPFDRAASLERLAGESFDVLIIGGGITGCGAALDAAARGLRTALVEAADFASGTSSKSSKMVHGGLRYIQQRDYRLVYEALHERQRLLNNAPHLVHPLPFLIPLFGKDGVVNKTVAKAYSTALWLYDITGGLRIGRRHRRITASEATAHFPVLASDGLAASFLYWDAQADDARLTLALARTAADRGAVLANYAPAVELLDQGGRVTGARLADGTEIRARVVVNAGGVWSERIARLAGTEGPSPVAIRPAKGVHLTVPASRLPCDYAAVLAVPGDKRSVFVVPWAADERSVPDEPGGFTYVGTTDTDYDGPLDDPQCTAEDVEYLLRAVNRWTSAALTPADVTGTWAGLRPLVSGARNARTADLSRRHAVVVSPDGLVTVTGGKLTTYRRMAADTIDAAVGQLGQAGQSGQAGQAGQTAQAGQAGRSPRRTPSSTARLPLIGAGDRSAPGLDIPLSDRLSVSSRTHLEGRYGSEAPQVLALAAADPSLLEPLVSGLPYLRAEAVWAARVEMAHTLTDVLARRTRALLLDREATASAAAGVAALLAPELGWDAEEQAAQVARLEELVDRERRASSSGVAAPAP
jgi:glycerol-3-phosphate dehydrogenase